MPRLRWRLTKPELAEYTRNAERLRRAGADFDASTFEMIDKPWISLKCYPAASYVRATTTACLFVIYLRLVVLAPKVVIQEFEVSSPDWPLNAYVLDNPSFANPEVQLYRLLDRATFHRTGVLNHRTGAEGILRRGDVLEGSLLAESLVSVPAKYVDHNWMRLCISISNQFDEVCEQEIELQVEHVPARPRPRPATRGSVFERTDNSCNRMPDNGSNPVIAEETPVAAVLSPGSGLYGGGDVMESRKANLPRSKKTQKSGSEETAPCRADLYGCIGVTNSS